MVAALVEGNSLRATARMTGVARMTIEGLLRSLGKADRDARSGSRAALHALQLRADSQTLRVTPALAAGVTGKLWEIADVVALLPDEL